MLNRTDIRIYSDPVESGAAAAKQIAGALNSAIEKNGAARLLLSTGASQFEMFDALVGEKVDWSKVEMFHLDEYIGIPYSHKASFRHYLNDRFVSRVPLKAAYLIDTEGDVKAEIARVSARLLEKPIDVGVIGIGENGHIAFNDPPADFETENPYLIVDLDEKCRKQQVGEGWFATLDDVPAQAVSMSVNRIMKCKKIVSVVPHSVKAWAVNAALTREISNTLPATILRTHPDWTLYIDTAAAADYMKAN